VVVELEGHLHVEANELRQVTMGVGVFGPEHAADRVDLAEAANDENALGWSLRISISTVIDTNGCYVSTPTLKYQTPMLPNLKLSTI
jgi:hypothetical protein